MIRLQENELYQEIAIYFGDTQIGEMEVDLKGKMLSRLSIYEPYQNKGYGQQVVAIAKEKYGCDCLWVRADNDRAIHVYEKFGFKKKGADNVSDGSSHRHPGKRGRGRVIITELKRRFHYFFCKDKLREKCREKYGDDFVKMYDMVGDGVPIGNLEETIIFLELVRLVEEGE